MDTLADQANTYLKSGGVVGSGSDGVEKIDPTQYRFVIEF